MKKGPTNTIVGMANNGAEEPLQHESSEWDSRPRLAATWVPVYDWLPELYPGPYRFASRNVLGLSLSGNIFMAVLVSSNSVIDANTPWAFIARNSATSTANGIGTQNPLAVTRRGRFWVWCASESRKICSMAFRRRRAANEPLNLGLC